MVVRSWEAERWAAMKACDASLVGGVPAPSIYEVVVTSLPPGLVYEAPFICTKVELAFFL